MGSEMQAHPGILCYNAEIEEGDDFFDGHGESDVLALDGLDILVFGHSVTAMDANGSYPHFA